MKSKFYPRHQKRIRLVQDLYAWSISGQSQEKENQPIINALPKIDNLIASAAPKWPLDQVNKVELAILRLAAWELENKPNIPPKVIIDEAIEIAKEYCDTSSSAFINAVLGKILTEHEHPSRK